MEFEFGKTLNNHCQSHIDLMDSSQCSFSRALAENVSERARVCWGSFCVLVMRLVSECSFINRIDSVQQSLNDVLRVTEFSPYMCTKIVQNAPSLSMSFCAFCFTIAISIELFHYGFATAAHFAAFVSSCDGFWVFWLCPRWEEIFKPIINHEKTINLLHQTKSAYRWKTCVLHGHEQYYRFEPHQLSNAIWARNLRLK